MSLSDESALVSVCTTDAVAASLDDLQYTLGEGPAVDARRTGRVVATPDLASESGVRWPALTPLALRAGVCAVFGFPVRIGAVRMGGLTVYRDRPGPMAEEQYIDVLIVADVAARAILAMQADAPPGGVAAELEWDRTCTSSSTRRPGWSRYSSGSAWPTPWSRLRAHAFRSSQSLDELGRGVVARRYRFDGEDS